MFTTPTRLTLTVGALCIWAIPILAQDTSPKPSAPPPPPKPASELSQLDYFVGNWSCTGKAFATPMNTEHPTRAHVHIKSELGGFWRHVVYQEDKTKENASPYGVIALWGYDATTKQFLAGIVDAMGGYGKSTSPGWSNDTLVFTGEMNVAGQKMPTRDTFTKTANGGLAHMGEMGIPDGSWMKTDEESCRKAGK